ncbi:MAG: hypothetical protein PHC28_13675 [Flavobacterium sp.]|uniref:hypothetical protein n=1 Tax=Flavobacterium sp. TaxID=239 RepID=UPI002605B22A|nr:hypothetical protein [Flavobacterium sp.]MDD5151502.1 hypothetical protein [Flavobacterium sp.]
MIKIVRYSNSAFIPQYQKKHLSFAYHDIFDFDEEMEKLRIEYPNIQQNWYILQERNRKQLEFYNIELENLKFGIWAFIDGHENKQSLNHIKGKLPLKWQAEIPKGTTVYNINLERKLKIEDSECELFGFFISSNELYKLKNIKPQGKYNDTSRIKKSK